MNKKVLTAVVLAGVMMTSGAALASGLQKTLTDRPEPPREFKGQRPPMMSRDERMRPSKPKDERSHNLNKDKRPPMPPHSRDRRPPEPRGVEPRR